MAGLAIQLHLIVILLLRLVLDIQIYPWIASSCDQLDHPCGRRNSPRALCCPVLRHGLGLGLVLYIGTFAHDYDIVI